MIATDDAITGHARLVLAAGGWEVDDGQLVQRRIARVRWTENLGGTTHYPGVTAGHHASRLGEAQLKCRV